jgi:hypothetical protein
MYNYLNTLRLHGQSAGEKTWSILPNAHLVSGGLPITLTVGPKRRVVFKNAIGDQTARSSAEANSLSKSRIKSALKPLAGYWSKPSESDHVPGAMVQPNVPVMSFHEFKTKARRLLAEAGLLVPKAEEGD